MTKKVWIKPGPMTGWPPGLLQDDCRELSRWFAERANARQLVRNNMSDKTQPTAAVQGGLTDERAAFEAHFKHLDHSTTKDAWGNPRPVYPLVGALWDGWQARAALSANARSLPNLPKAFKVETPRNSEPYGLFTAKQMIEYRLAS